MKNQYTVNDEERKALLHILNCALKEGGVNILGTVSYFIKKFDIPRIKNNEVNNGE